MLSSVISKNHRLLILVTQFASVLRLTFYCTKTSEFKITKKLFRPFLYQLHLSVWEHSSKETRNLILPSLLQKLCALVRASASVRVYSTARTHSSCSLPFQSAWKENPTETQHPVKNNSYYHLQL